MSSVTRPSRFFGLDLQLLGRELRAAWQQIQEWPVLGWLSPAVPVCLQRGDGQAGLWLVDGDSARFRGGDVSAARFTAVELPEDDLLLRRIELPPLPAGEVDQAVALEVAGASPFAAEDLVWGYARRRTPSGNLEIQMALASRKQITSYLQTLSARIAGDGAPEVWAMAGPSTPVVFNGFGETRRVAHARVRQRATLALVLLALGLAAAIAVTPVAQARLRAIDAQQASTELTKRVEPLIRQRAALLRNVETGQSLNEILADRADPLFVMDLLTRVLPDDTSLLGLNIQGSKVSITGSTSDAAALMQQLSARAELREVKAPTPATRPPGTSKDSFNIEFMLASAPPRAATAARSQQASATPGASAAAVSASAPAPAVPAAAALLGSPPAAPVPQSAAPQPSAAPAARSGGASFGGATFGAPPAPAKAP
jgi:general secretion pathway protein L